LIKLPMASHLDALPAFDQSLPFTIEPVEVALVLACPSCISWLPPFSPITAPGFGQDGGRVHFDLHLRPTVPLFTDTLRRMLNLVWGSHPSADSLRPAGLLASLLSLTSHVTCSPPFPSPLSCWTADHRSFTSLQKLLCPTVRPIAFVRGPSDLIS
jgi:hypothetical protein